MLYYNTKIFTPCQQFFKINLTFLKNADLLNVRSSKTALFSLITFSLALTSILSRCSYSSLCCQHICSIFSQFHSLNKKRRNFSISLFYKRQLYYFFFIFIFPSKSIKRFDCPVTLSSLSTSTSSSNIERLLVYIP